MSGAELDIRFLEDVRNRLLQEGGALTDARIARAIQDTGRVLGVLGQDVVYIVNG